MSRDKSSTKCLRVCTERSGSGTVISSMVNVMPTRLIQLVLVIWLVAGCTPTRGGAPDLLPDIPNTQVVEGQKIQDFIKSLANGAALTAGQPELFAAVQFADGVIGCYQQIGAVAVRAYTDRTFPLSAGFVAVVDRNAATNPANLQQCLQGRPSAQSAAPTVQPCAQTYTLKKDDNEFFIAYLATTKEMCEAICSRLEGCTAK
jgi:hypothetical protein